jgi:hypothetical protein
MLKKLLNYLSNMHFHYWTGYSVDFLDFDKNGILYPYISKQCVLCKKWKRYFI